MERGDLILAVLREPREQIWGVLLRLDTAGLEIRGLDARNFEEWARQIAAGSPAQLGPATVYYPSHRIERVSLDEPVGAVPSMEQRFREIVGREPKEHLG